MEGTLNQPYILAAAMYAGMAAGLIYSLFRFLRKALGGGKAFTIALDVLFALLLLGLIGTALYMAADLELRAYHFIGIAIGFAIYMLGVCPIARFLYCKFFKAPVDKLRKKRFNKKRGEAGHAEQEKMD